MPDLPPPNSAADTESLAADGGRLDSLCDIQCVETIYGRAPRQSRAIRAVRLLLVARTPVERQIVALHVLQGDGLDATAYACGLSSCRTRELFRNLELRDTIARKRICRLRKLAKKKEPAKGRRTGKSTPQSGPLVPRLIVSNAVMASAPAGAGIDGAGDADDRGPSVGRTASDRRPGMSDTGDSEADFPQDDFQED